MDDQPQNDAQVNNDLPGPTPAPEAPAEQNDQPEQAAPEAPAAPARSRSRKAAAPADQPANSQVLGESEADKNFDAVAHGQQTALENHRAEHAND